VWLIAEKVARIFLGLGATVLMARYLGPEGFGTIEFALSFVLVFSAFVQLGLEKVVVREVVRKPEQVPQILGAALMLRLAGAMLLVVVTSSVAAIAEYGQDARMAIFVISAAYAAQSLYVFEYYFHARVRGRRASIAGMLGSAISASIKVILILTNAPLLFFAFAVGAEYIAKGAALTVAYATDSTSARVPVRMSISLMQVLFRDAWPLALSGLVVMIYLRIDQVMIQALMTTEAVGKYAAAVRLSEGWYFVPLGITQSFFPAVLAAKARSKEVYEHRMQLLYDALAWLGIAVAVAMTVVSGPLMKGLFGPDYASSAVVLRIQVWAGVFVGLGVAAARWVVSENLTLNVLVRTTSGAALNVLLNLLLIPLLGIAGASIATLVSYIFVNFASLSIFPSTRSAFRMQLRALNPVAVVQRRFVGSGG